MFPERAKWFTCEKYKELKEIGFQNANLLFSNGHRIYFYPCELRGTVKGEPSKFDLRFLDKNLYPNLEEYIDWFNGEIYFRRVKSFYVERDTYNKLEKYTIMDKMFKELQK